jgi:hypothetical protein
MLVKVDQRGHAGNENVCKHVSYVREFDNYYCIDCRSNDGVNESPISITKAGAWKPGYLRPGYIPGKPGVATYYEHFATRNSNLATRNSKARCRVELIMWYLHGRTVRRIVRLNTLIRLLIKSLISLMRVFRL